MSQTILVVNDEKLQNTLKVNLDVYIKTDVIERSKSDEVVTLLGLLPEVDLMIIEHTPNNGIDAKEILKAVADGDLLIPTIVLGDLEVSDELAMSMPITTPWDQLIKIAADKFGINQEELYKRGCPDFFPIPLYYFEHLDRANVDIYCKYSQDPKNISFVKKFKGSSRIRRDDIEEMRQKGLNFFYILRTDLELFINFVDSRVSEMLEDDDMVLDRRVQMCSYCYKLVTHQVRNVGMLGATVQLALAMVDNIVFSANRVPKYELLMDSLKKFNAPFSYGLLHFSSILAYDVIRRSEWGTQDHHERLTFALVFCDALLENDEHVRIKDTKELGKKNDKDKKLILEHAKVMSEIATNAKGLPKGCDNLIRSHHGVAEGVGYADAITKSYSPLGNILVLAQDVASAILANQVSRDKISHVKKKIENRYTHDAFKGIVDKMFESLSA